MNVELGIGLIGIGREWGQTNNTIPTPEMSLELLNRALGLGITFFDTAPAYGSSEERLGHFLTSLPQKKRNDIIVATKFGEHWDKESNSTYIDHSFKALRASIDHSLTILGSIDVIQIHKTNPTVLESRDVRQAIEYAKSKGIVKIGASISDEISGQMVCNDNDIDFIQLPFNLNNHKLGKIIQSATRKGKKVIINRPFDTGNLVTNQNSEQEKEQVEIQCYKFILQQGFEGYILTGTKSPSHLEANLRAFQKSKWEFTKKAN